MAMLGDPNILFVDLRESAERARHGVIPGALHETYTKLAAAVGAGGVIRALSASKKIVFYCAYGERSAMAVQAAQNAGLDSVHHLQGGLAAWKEAGGPLDRYVQG
jgi:rhodanese-related sulfurtransferase